MKNSKLHMNIDLDFQAFKHFKVLLVSCGMCSSLLPCLDNIYFEIWDRQCWSWLIFRQGRGLFCRTGWRSCNFWKWVQSPMLTGNVCCSECIHTASTNKQYDTISTLWLHRTTGERRRERETVCEMYAEKTVRKQTMLASQQIHLYKVSGERREIVAQTHKHIHWLWILTSAFLHNLNAHVHLGRRFAYFQLNWGGSLWEAHWKMWHI